MPLTPKYTWNQTNTTVEINIEIRGVSKHVLYDVLFS